jgi:hypothetical protein
MATQRPLPFVLVCALGVFASLSACDRGPRRTASGEEIDAAVQQAERELAEARAKPPSRPGD